MGSMDMGGSALKMGSSSSSSKMSSSSFSSSSSSSMMSSGMSSMLGGGMPPLRGMEMPGMTIEEMPAAQPSTPYTVSSPPPTSHRVGAGADYAAPSLAEQDTSVLLQCKTGSDYKLVLNMQQFGPDDITIKLSGRTLTVEAQRHGEQFRQKHDIPDHVDLDSMTSSFSSDGVLVIKAPKLQ